MPLLAPIALVIPHLDPGSSGGRLAVSLGAALRTGGGRTTPVQIMLVAGALIIAVIALGLIVIAVRNRLLDKGGGSMVSPGGMMLSELRKARDRGEITIEEYEAARDAMVGGGGGGGRGGGGGASGSTANLTRPLPRPKNDAGTRADGALVARPGYDLTGRPLPRLGQAEAPPGPGAEPGERSGN